MEARKRVPFQKNSSLINLQWGILVEFNDVFLGLILCTVGFHYDDYGGEYHCWTNMGVQGLLMWQVVPLAIMTILTFTVIEAAGASEYRRLPGVDQQQLVSAKFMQRSILIILPLVFISFIIGMLSEYEQNVPLYGTFTILNGILGG